LQSIAALEHDFTVVTITVEHRSLKMASMPFVDTKAQVDRIERYLTGTRMFVVYDESWYYRLI
jgi:hypothetical protein